MKRSEYNAYQARVDKFFRIEGINNLSFIEGTYENETTTRCDCCHTTAFGDRCRANGWNPVAEEIQEYTVCEDCLYYAEYGQLDDMTMMDMEEDVED